MHQCELHGTRQDDEDWPTPEGESGLHWDFVRRLYERGWIESVQLCEAYYIPYNIVYNVEAPVDVLAIFGSTPNHPWHDWIVQWAVSVIR
jgi:hypothetical protein